MSLENIPTWILLLSDCSWKASEKKQNKNKRTVVTGRLKELWHQTEWNNMNVIQDLLHSPYIEEMRKANKKTTKNQINKTTKHLALKERNWTV